MRNKISFYNVIIKEKTDGKEKGGFQVNLEMLKKQPYCLDEAQLQWVRETYESMSLEEKIGQLFCMITFSSEDSYLKDLTQKYHTGGIMARPLPTKEFCEFVNKAQSYSKVPLFISANIEAGGDGLVEEGTNIGCNLQIAATGKLENVKKQAYVCAREAKALGANISFAPVVDIDMNFRNPIMNTRTYGSDPEFVKNAASVYVTELQEDGIAAVPKHFPGDGVDERDQHLVTSVNSLSCEEWDKTYGEIYKACIAAGTKAIMVGHIMQPAYSKKLNPEIKEEDILPASLSKELLQGLLRGQLGFNGLILTDASTMAGMCIPMRRKDAVPAAIAAGADVFLFCKNMEEDYQYMMDGYRNGVITPERLEEALLRILGTKASLHLQAAKLPTYEEAVKVIGCPAHKELEKEFADEAVTLVKNKQDVLPLDPAKTKRVLLCPLTMKGNNYFISEKDDFKSVVKAAFEKEGFEVELFAPDPAMEGVARPFSYTEEKYDLIVYAANLATQSNQTIVRIEWDSPMGANCPNYLNSVPTIFISFANPYHLLDAPRIKTYINAYKFKPVMVQSVMDHLMGRKEFTGVSPVDAFCGKWDTRL